MTYHLKNRCVRYYITAEHVIMCVTYATPHPPIRSRIALGGASGLLKIWDYEKNEVISSRVFERSAPISTLAYHPRAFSLG